MAERIPTIEGTLLKGARKHWPWLSLLATAPMLVHAIQEKLSEVESARAKANYGIPREAGVLALKTGKKLWKWGRRHPKIVRTGGAFTTGVLTQRALQKRRTGYQFTPKGVPSLKPGAAPFPPPSGLKKLPRAAAKLGKAGARKLGSGALFGLAAWIAAEILDKVSKKAYLPEIRPDIETFNLVVQYAGEIPTPLLQRLRARTGAALKRTRTGVEKGLLLWLMGFVTAELLARGITKKQTRHEVVFGRPQPLHQQQYKLPPGMHEISPDDLHRKLVRESTQAKAFRKADATFASVIKKRKGPRLRLGRAGRLSVALAPLAAIALLRRRRQNESYSFRSAAARTLKISKTVARGGMKGLSGATNVLFPALLISELWPRKRKKLPQQSYSGPIAETPTKPKKSPPGTYICPECGDAIIIWHTPVDEYKTRCPKCNVQMVRRTAYTLDTPKKLPPGSYVCPECQEAAVVWRTSVEEHKLNCPKCGVRMERVTRFEIVETYPFKSAAQRRWMHTNKPKMAKEWEEETPEGKKLPEHASKHALRSGYGKSIKEFLQWLRQQAATKGPAGVKFDTARKEVEAHLRKRRHRLVAVTALGTATGVVVGKRHERERIRKLIA